MPREVKIPRVVIPRASQEVATLARTVANEMENEGDITISGATQFGLIQEALDAGATAMQSALNAAIAAENTARIERAKVSAQGEICLAELRNARDFKMSHHPENPMLVSEWGFVAYASSSSSNPTDGGTSDPPADDGSGDDDDGGTITPA